MHLKTSLRLLSALLFMYESVVMQLEDLEVTVADHVQKVMVPTFSAAWEEVGGDCETEETYALSSMKTLDGTHAPVVALY